MVSFVKSLVGRLFGGAGEAPSQVEEAVPYKDFRIRPAPYPSRGQHQTAGVIEKDFPDGPREHRFVRAETHASRQEAIDFSVRKAKQIIDEQGDRLFGDR